MSCSPELYKIELWISNLYCILLGSSSRNRKLYSNVASWLWLVMSDNPHSRTTRFLQDSCKALILSINMYESTDNLMPPFISLSYTIYQDINWYKHVSTRMKHMTIVSHPPKHGSGWNSDTPGHVSNAGHSLRWLYGWGSPPWGFWLPQFQHA